MLSTIVRSLFPSASSEHYTIPDFGGRWSPVVGGGRGAYYTSSGENISETSAFAISAWFACIRNISEDIAKLPLNVYERDDDSRESKYEHPVAKALRRPNDEMTSFSFRETMMQHALGFGNAYAEISVSPTGDIPELWPLDPTRVVIVNTDGRMLYRYSDPDTHRTVDFRPNQMLHIHGPGFDGRCGYSPVMLFREMLGATIARMKATGAIWRNGLFVGGVLQHPASLGDAALTNLRQSFEKRHGGGDNAGRLMILEEGMTYNQLGIDPERAQMNESGIFNIEELARVYRMPLHKIGHLYRSTFNNIEHQAREYVVDCLTPWIVRCEQEYDRKLLADDDALYTKHNVMGLLRGDERARADFYLKMVQVGMTQNQMLALEDMPGIGPEGDIPYIAMNLRPATEEAREAATKKPEPVQPNAAPIEDHPDPDMPEDKGGRPKESIATSYIEVMETVLEPLARKEVNAVSKAAQKHFDAPDKFLTTVARFHIEHAEQLRVALEPAVGALVSMLGGARNDPRIDVMVRAWIVQNRETKTAQLAICDFPQGVERAMELWMTRDLRDSASDLVGVGIGLSERVAA